MRRQDSLHRCPCPVQGCILIGGVESPMSVAEVDRHTSIDPLAAWMAMQAATGTEKPAYPTGGLTPLWGRSLGSVGC
jgi:hypothetical protein